MSSKAFSEIQLNENSKFQISFQDITGHILFDRNAINLIKLSNGIFEIWTENHKQSDLARGNNNVNVKYSAISNDTLRTMKIVRNAYFKLMELAINQIFLTPRSYFRFGFVNSNSVLLLNPKSLNGFHVERFDNKSRMAANTNDYRTKIEFEINESDNVKLNFLFKDLKQVNLHSHLLF